LSSAVQKALALPPSDHFRVGLSPHAPYSAGVAAYVAVMREAAAHGWPVTTHLHETLAEIALYATGRGEFKSWLLVRAALLLSGFRHSGRSPIQTLAAAGFFTQPVLVGHGNYLDDGDIDILRRSGSTVVYCPRSHDYFGHRHHPYARLLAAGVPVALGTDSLASAPSLSILDELRFLHERDPQLPPDTLLAMATSAGADALGRQGEAGRLATGEAADFVAIAAPEIDDNPYAALLNPGAAVRGVWTSGTPMVSEPAATRNDR
jgi:aminodeoxyfutalosine deaminase